MSKVSKQQCASRQWTQNSATRHSFDNSLEAHKRGTLDGDFFYFVSRYFPLSINIVSDPCPRTPHRCIRSRIGATRWPSLAACTSIVRYICAFPLYRHRSASCVITECMGCLPCTASQFFSMWRKPSVWSGALQNTSAWSHHSAGFKYAGVSNEQCAWLIRYIEGKQLPPITALGNVAHWDIEVAGQKSGSDVENAETDESDTWLPCYNCLVRPLVLSHSHTSDMHFINTFCAN